MEHLTEAEEERLPRAIQVIGRAASRTGPHENESFSRPAAPWWRRHRGVLAASAVLAACAVAIVSAVGVIDSVNSGAPDQEATQALSGPERIACAKQIFDGTIASVEPTEKRSEVTMTVNVDKWYKAEGGKPPTVTYRTGSAWSDDIPPYRPGQRVLAVVYGPPDSPVGGLAPVYRGKEAYWERKGVKRYRAEAQHTPCPDFWRHPGRHNVPGDS